MRIHPSGPYQLIFKDADFISAIDANDRSRHLTVWGSDVVAPGRKPGSAPRTLKIVEVEIDQSSEKDLQNLLRMVVEIKGHLPASVRERFKT